MSVEKLLPSKYGYSNVAITDGRLAFVARQIAEDDPGALAGRDDFEAQLRQVVLSLKATLNELNVSPDDVVKLNYYIVGLAPDRLITRTTLSDQRTSGSRCLALDSLGTRSAGTLGATGRAARRDASGIRSSGRGRGCKKLEYA